MLIAYIDEVGEAGAFISKDHKRFKISPVFGYAGFVVPEQQGYRTLRVAGRVTFWLSGAGKSVF